jgi:hypothetical protein
MLVVPRWWVIPVLVNLILLSATIMMSRSRLSNFSYSPVQHPQFSLKIDHEAR